MSNSSKRIKIDHLQKLVKQSALNGAHVIDITNTCTVALLKTKNPLILLYREERVNWKKTEDGENIFFKALVNRFRLTSKLIRHVKEQQSCLWQTFYQMDFVKR